MSDKIFYIHKIKYIQYSSRGPLSSPEILRVIGMGSSFVDLRSDAVILLLHGLEGPQTRPREGRRGPYRLTFRGGGARNDYSGCFFIQKKHVSLIHKIQRLGNGNRSIQGNLFSAPGSQCLQGPCFLGGLDRRHDFPAGWIGGGADINGIPI